MQRRLDVQGAAQRQEARAEDRGRRAVAGVHLRARARRPDARRPPLRRAVDVGEGAGGALRSRRRLQRGQLEAAAGARPRPRSSSSSTTSWRATAARAPTAARTSSPTPSSTPSCRQLDALRRVMPPIFLLVSAFLINITLARMIALEREQIGLLKALGYGPLPIAAHYVKIVLAITVVGILIGSVAGAWLGKGLTRLYADFFHFPFLIFRHDADVYAIAGAGLDPGRRRRRAQGRAATCWRSPPPLPCSRRRRPATAGCFSAGWCPPRCSPSSRSWRCGTSRAGRSVPRRPRSASPSALPCW